MNDFLVILACGVTGGLVAGITAALVRPSGRRRGEHRRWWHRAPREDAFADTDVPHTALSPPGEGVTEPLPRIHNP